MQIFDDVVALRCVLRHSRLQLFDAFKELHVGDFIGTLQRSSSKLETDLKLELFQCVKVRHQHLFPLVDGWHHLFYRQRLVARNGETLGHGVDEGFHTRHCRDDFLEFLNSFNHRHAALRVARVDRDTKDVAYFCQNEVRSLRIEVRLLGFTRLGDMSVVGIAC